MENQKKGKKNNFSSVKALTFWTMPLDNAKTILALHIATLVGHSSGLTNCSHVILLLI